MKRQSSQGASHPCRQWFLGSVPTAIPWERPAIVFKLPGEGNMAEPRLIKYFSD